MTEDSDNQYIMIDSTIVRAHQQAACEKGTRREALGRSRGGLSTKIHMCANAFGRPLRFILTGGQRNDCTQALDLISGFTPSHVLADKGLRQR